VGDQILLDVSQISRSIQCHIWIVFSRRPIPPYAFFEHICISALYRDVARPDELVGEGNFYPKLADNAEELISYALSFIPKRDGPRGSRQKKRMAHKWEIKRRNDARRKQETHHAIMRKHAKAKKDRELAKKYREQALALRARAAGATGATGSAQSGGGGGGDSATESKQNQSQSASA
jgi:hypothetical protein